MRPGWRRPFLQDVLWRSLDDASLGGEDDEIVFGDDVAAGTQAVAVESCADDATVSECDGGGTVPRLHQRGVVLVEGTLVFVHVGIASPSLGNEHGHDVRQGTAGLEQELDGIVERAGVAAAWTDERIEVVDLVAE